MVRHASCRRPPVTNSPSEEHLDAMGNARQIQRINENMERYLALVVVMEILECRGSKTEKSAASNDQIPTVRHDFHAARNFGDRFAGVCS